MRTIWNRDPRGRRIPRCTTRVVLSLLCIGVYALLPAGAGGASTASTVEIRSLELVEMGPDARLEIRASGPLAWTTYRNSAVELVLELPESLPSTAVVSFETPQGLVESVEVEKLVGAVNSTRLVIRTRVEAEHTVVTEPGSLRLDLIAMSSEQGMENAPIEAVVTAVDEPSLPEPSLPKPSLPKEGRELQFEVETGVQETSTGFVGDPRAPGTSSATELRGVEVSFAGERTKIWILGDGEFYFSTFQLQNPDRFVIDLIGVVNQAPVSSIPVGNDLIKQVRVAQFKPMPEPVARVVIDLFEAGRAEVESLADGLVISFGAPAANPSTSGVPNAAVVRDTSTIVEALRAPSETPESSRLAEQVDSETPAVLLDEAEPEESEVIAQPEPEPADQEWAQVADTESDDSLAHDPFASDSEPIEVPNLGGATPATSMPEMDAAPLPEIFLDEIGEVEATDPEFAAPNLETTQAAEAEVPLQGETDWAATTVEVDPVADEVEIAVAEIDSAQEEDLIAQAAAAYDEDEMIAQIEPAFESAVEESFSEVDVLAAEEEDSDPTVVHLGSGSKAFEGRTLGGGQRKYQGAPMSLSLKDGDIKDVLRSFAQISGLNVVVQPTVSGTVTVELTQVPWDQALEQILKINGLDYELEGNIMRIAPIALLRAEAEERQRLVAAQSLSVPLTTIIKRVSYADAREVAALLRSGGSASLMSQRGTALVDTRTNTLIIKELPTFMDTVLAVIEHLDTPEPQVMIEARIIETTKRFSRSLGVEWNFAGVSDAAHGNTTGLVFPNNGSVEGGVNLLTGAANGFLDVSLGNILSTFQLDATLHAAESEGLINILSAPRITTLNNERASIQSGLQIPIQTVANNTVSVQFVNATLRLDVTPHVTAEGTVLMDINIQKREPQLAFAVVGATNAPIATKDARTRVIVRDGGTTVIGGIYKVTSDQGEDRVPGLANIPLIKHLFKNKRRSDENEELLIFITPRVTRL